MKRSRHHSTKFRLLTAAIVVTAAIVASMFCAWWFIWRDTRPKAIPATEATIAALTIDAADLGANGAVNDGTILSFPYVSAALFLEEGMADEQGNANYSPASLWLALAIAAQGADGQTREQLDETLGLTGLADEDYRSLVQSINGRYGDAKSQMSTANSLWLNQKQAKPLQSFVDAARQTFDAQVKSETYDAQTPKHMSQWISRRTEGMLKPEIQVSPNEVMSIIGTVYADGVWSSPFNPDHTLENTFRGTAGKSRVMFMNQYFDSLTYLRDAEAGWQRADIPFDNGGALRIVLPDDGRFEDIAGDAEALRDAFEINPDKTLASSETEAFPPVQMLLPRFSIDSSFASEQTKETLRSLGIIDAFDADSADFSQMGTSQSGEPLFIGSVVQGTRIEVNEHGAKAAAFSKVDMEATGAPEIPDDLVEFTVDRPFFYSLVTPDGIPLFLGAVRNL